MLHYVILSTGSCGNSYAFYDGTDTVVVDMGLTWKKFHETLERHDIPVESVRDCFLTHLHPDHSKGGYLLQTNIPGIKVHISEISRKMSQSVLFKYKIRQEEGMLHSFTHGETIRVGNFSVTPFRTSHDCPGSSGYYIENGEAKLFLMTDTGLVTEEAHEPAEKAKVLFLEANYDRDMLMAGPYTAALKKRIQGGYGHLANDESAAFAKEHCHIGDELWLIHLSAENNTPETVETAFRKELPSGIAVKACERGATYEGFIENEQEKEG